MGRMSGMPSDMVRRWQLKGRLEECNDWLILTSDNWVDTSVRAFNASDC